jgi:hypothetical protein
MNRSLALSRLMNRSLALSNGIRGTRSRASEAAARNGPLQIGGSISFNPDPAMLDLWLPRILARQPSAPRSPWRKRCRHSEMLSEC